MSDSLKQAVEGLEAAWSRLREVLDGPDVAAALVERQTVRPMSTAPRDGTVVMLHFDKEHKVRAYCRCTFAGGPRHWGTGPLAEHNIGGNQRPIGWSPVKPQTNQCPGPMSTAPRDGTPVVLHRVGGGRVQALFNVSYRCWVDQQNVLLSSEGSFIGWSPVK